MRGSLSKPLFVSLLALVFLQFFWGEHILISGNIHDIFIPINAAIFIENKEDFSSPLGPAYFYLNYFSYLLVGYFDFLELEEIQLVSSSVFFLLIFVSLAVYVGWELAAKDYLFLSAAILLSMQTRFVGDFNPYMQYWYGSYNNHCWVVVALCVYLVCRAYSAGGLTNVFGTKLISLLSFLLFFLLCYKVSFFIAALPLIIAIIALGFVFRGIIVLYPVVIILFLACIFLAYSPGEYLSALMMALKAKSLTDGTPYSSVGFYFFATILLFLSLCWREITIAEDLFFILMVVFATIMSALASLGDFSGVSLAAVFLPSIVVAFFYKASPLRGFSIFVIFIFSLINFLGFLIMFSGKSVSPIGFKKFGFNYNGEAARIIYPDQSSGIFDFEYILTRGAPSLSDKIVVSRFVPRRYDEFPGYRNSDYTKSLMHLFEKYGGEFKGKRVSFNSFSNPGPVLFGSALPNKKLHWAHYGTTFSDLDKNVFFDEYGSSDYVLIPIYAVNSKEQGLLNLFFYDFNEKFNRYYLSGHTDGFLVFKSLAL